MKQKLVDRMILNNLAQSRAQAQDYIRLGYVLVNNYRNSDINYTIDTGDKIALTIPQTYVSRAGLKLAAVVEVFRLDFNDKTVLDVGSSTGGFTDFALQNGAIKVIAVEVGTNQLHSKLRSDKRIELHEQTDIRNLDKLSSPADLILVDVSFISSRDILPALLKFASKSTKIVVMFKPQFEASSELKNNGIIKNDRIRRNLIRDFESWLKKNNFIILGQADSVVSGTKGNIEKFYILKT